MSVAVIIGGKVFGTFQTRSEALEHCAKGQLRFRPRVEHIRTRVRVEHTARELQRVHRDFRKEARIAALAAPVDFHL